MLFRELYDAIVVVTSATDCETILKKRDELRKLLPKFQIFVENWELNFPEQKTDAQ